MSNHKDGPGITYTANMILNPIIKFTTEQLIKIREDLSKNTEGSILSEEAINKTLKKLEKVKEFMKPLNERDENTQSIVGGMKAISSAEDKVASEGIKLVKKSVGFLEDIHQRLVTASPLLRTIESLFTLAMQLFFMPLGNKLAEIMIPAVTDLVKQVTDLWKSFEGKSLSQILNIMIEKGAQIIGDYFNNLAKDLDGENSLLGSIASILSTIGNLIQSGTLVTLVNAGVALLNFIISHFKELIALIVGFKVASLANQVQTMFVIAASATAAGKVGAGLIAAGATVNSAALGTAAASGTYSYLDSGGDLGAAFIGATPVGIVQNTGKVAAREITGAASQVLKTINNTSNIVNNFNGITDVNFKKMVIDVLNEQFNEYKTRGVFH